MAPFRILSLDGGGIRGIIPALVLAELERRTDRRTAQLFDLIAGTSTGGILALGLTRPGPDGAPLYSADEMVSLYVKDGGKIFDRGVMHRLKALGNLADEKYPSDGIDAVLEERFGAALLAGRGPPETQVGQPRRSFQRSRPRSEKRRVPPESFFANGSWAWCLYIQCRETPSRSAASIAVRSRSGPEPFVLWVAGSG